MTFAQTIGSIPAAATCFKVQKRVPNEKKGGLCWAQQLAQGPTAADVAVSTFPITHLSTDIILQLWGPGSYRVAFWLQDDSGRMKFVKNSSVFDLLPASPAAQRPMAPPTEAPPPGPPPALDTTHGIFAAARELSRESIAMTQSFCQLQIEIIRADAQRQLSQAQADNERRERQDRAYHLEMERMRARAEQPMRQFARRLESIEEALTEESDEPEPAVPTAPLPPPGGTFTDEHGNLSVGKLLELAKDHGPQAVELVRALMQPKPATN